MASRPKNFNLPDSLCERLRGVAYQRRLSQTDIVIEALWSFLNQHDSRTRHAGDDGPEVFFDSDFKDAQDAHEVDDPFDEKETEK